MALIKNIELENGIITNYHRVASLTKVTNQVNNIEVNSYISKEKREEEKEKIAEGQKTGTAVPMNVLVIATYIQVPYDESMSIEDAYTYLKATNQFKDAEDDNQLQ